MKRKLSFKKLNMLLLASVLATGTVGMTTGQIVSAQENKAEELYSPKVISTAFGIPEKYGYTNSPFFIINFSEPMDTTLNGTVEVVDSNNNSIPLESDEILDDSSTNWINNNQTLIVAPLAPIDTTETYTISVSGFVTAYDQVVPDYTSTVSFIGDSAKPSVTNVDYSVIDNEIYVTFSSPMLTTKEGKFALGLTTPEEHISTTYEWETPRVLVVTPSVPLEASTEYELGISGFYSTSCELMNIYSTTFTTI